MEGEKLKGGNGGKVCSKGEGKRRKGEREEVGDTRRGRKMGNRGEEGIAP